MITQGKQLVLSGIAGGVFAFGRKREFTSRTKHMTMRIHRACGWHKIRLFGVRVPRNFAACYRVNIGHAKKLL
jgi:hypothetical protein